MDPQMGAHTDAHMGVHTDAHMGTSVQGHICAQICSPYLSSFEFPCGAPRWGAHVERPHGAPYGRFSWSTHLAFIGTPIWAPMWGAHMGAHVIAHMSAHLSVHTVGHVGDRRAQPHWDAGGVVGGRPQVFFLNKQNQAQ